MGSFSNFSTIIMRLFITVKNIFENYISTFWPTEGAKLVEMDCNWHHQMRLKNLFILIYNNTYLSQKLFMLWPKPFQNPNFRTFKILQNVLNIHLLIKTKLIEIQKSMSTLFPLEKWHSTIFWRSQGHTRSFEGH